MGKLTMVNTAPQKRFNRVHAVCQALRDGINCKRTTVCKRCPSVENFGPGAGRGVRGCYVRAREIVNIVKIGWPWRTPPKNKRGKSWRKRAFK